MGNANSSNVPEVLKDRISLIQSDLLRMNRVDYNDVVNFLEILNSIMQDVAADESSLVTFKIINPNVKGNILWKLLLRISCVKTKKGTGEVLSERKLKLYHLIRLFEEITYQVVTIDYPVIVDGIFSNNSVSMSTSSFEIPQECPICWDRTPDVVLSCAGNHAYCSKCIEQWNRECPLCRSESDSESWQFVDSSETSDGGQMQSYRNKILMGLADKAGSPN